MKDDEEKILKVPIITSEKNLTVHEFKLLYCYSQVSLWIADRYTFAVKRILKFFCRREIRGLNSKNSGRNLPL